MIYIELYLCKTPPKASPHHICYKPSCFTGIRIAFIPQHHGRTAPETAQGGYKKLGYNIQMNVKLLVFISHGVYVLTCFVFGFYEPSTAQRKVAFFRSNLNFFLLYCLSSCIPFYNVPVSNKPVLYVLMTWIVIADLVFTVSHRLLHTKWLYWLHKQHHANNPSYSTSTFDAHVVEYLFGNVATGLVPMLCVPGSHMTQLIWILSANVNTVSGHHLEGPHLLHHKLLNCNYGQGFYVWDRLFGTYRSAVKRV